ncbi:hypothetical protein [Moorena sp. SIO4G3]|nr:hypothetical protein [Moorena sp. SIO4G3]
MHTPPMESVRKSCKGNYLCIATPYTLHPTPYSLFLLLKKITKSLPHE